MISGVDIRPGTVIYCVGDGEREVDFVVRVTADPRTDVWYNNVYELEGSNKSYRILWSPEALGSVT